MRRGRASIPSRRWRTGTLALVAGLAAAGAPHGVDSAAPAAGPFDVLEWTGGVTTSRNGYAVWISIPSTRHRARIPDHAREAGPPEHRAALHVACRAAGGGMPDTFPAAPAHGGLYLDDHPEQPDAYLVFHPMYWILELMGRTTQHWPVELRVPGDVLVTGTLERRLTDYSAPRPGLDMLFPGETVIDAILGEDPIEIEATGPGVRFAGEFSASANARRAAALMRTACPQG